MISCVTDTITSEKNSLLTPGGTIYLECMGVKIAGNHPANGIALINRLTNGVVIIDDQFIVRNEPGEISFKLPVVLPEGNYKLCLTTQYSNSDLLLISPRTYIFDGFLEVKAFQNQ